MNHQRGHRRFERTRKHSQYDRYGRREVEQQRTYREDMIAAGRAHLLPEGERTI